MKHKLNKILLVDDDDATNFLHEMVIEEADCTEKVISVFNGQEALDYLTRKEEGDYPQPDIIFLDINMPAMNGWEFLDAYNNLENSQKARTVVVMLTTSLNPDDKDKSTKIGNIKGFMNKPLTVEMLNDIIKEYFPEKF